MSQRWALFFMVAVGVFLSTMDSSMINVALPELMRTFHATLPQTEWVVIIYLLTITVTLLLWGNLADRFSRGKIYLYGMLGFALGSIGCAISPTLSVLILFRFFQALGASMMMSSGPALIKVVFPEKDLGMALGMVGIATSSGLMSGPVVSGFLLEMFSWRAIFLVTLPLSLSVFFYFSLVILPKLETIQQNNLQQHQFDLKGFLSWSTFIGLTVVLITNHQAFSRIVIALGVIALFFLFVSFLWIETHTKNPLLPLNLFENRNFVIGISCATFSFAVLFVVLILMPFYLDTVLKFQPQKIGMMMMAVPLLVFAVSPVSGRLYDRYGAKVLTTSGLALSMSALGLLCFLGPETGFWYIFISLSILGCGQALFLSPNSAALLMEGDAHHSGIVSGLLATSRNMGMLAGVSLGGLVFGLVFAANSGGLDIRDYTGGLENEFIRALRYTFIGTALLSGAAMVLSWQRSS